MFGWEDDDDFEDDVHELLPEEIEAIYLKYQPPPIDLSTRNIVGHPTYSDALRTSNNKSTATKPSEEPIKEPTIKPSVPTPNLFSANNIKQQVTIQKQSNVNSKKQKPVLNPISAQTNNLILTKTQRKKLNKKLREQGNITAPKNEPPKATKALTEKPKKTEPKIVKIKKKVSKLCNGRSSATSNRDNANDNDISLSTTNTDLSMYSTEEEMVNTFSSGNFSIASESSFECKLNRPSTSKSTPPLKLQNESIHVSKQTKSKKTKQNDLAPNNLNTPVEKRSAASAVNKKQKKSAKTKANTEDKQGQGDQKSKKTAKSKKKNKIQPLPLPKMVKPVLFCCNRPMELKREEVEIKIEVATKMACSKFTPAERLLMAINKTSSIDDLNEIGEVSQSSGKLSKGQRKRINRKKRILESKKLAELEEEEMVISRKIAEETIHKDFTKFLHDCNIDLPLMELLSIEVETTKRLTTTTPKTKHQIIAEATIDHLNAMKLKQDFIRDLSEDYSKYVYYNNNPLFKDDLPPKNKKNKTSKTKKLTTMLKNDIPNCYHYYQYDNQNFVNFLRFKNYYLNGSLLTIKCIKNYLSTTEINHNAITFFANIMITQFLHALQQSFELFTLVNISRNKFVEKCTILLDNKSKSCCFMTKKDAMYLPNKIMEEFMENLGRIKKMSFIEEINIQIKNGNIHHPNLIKRMESLEMYTSKKVETAIFLIECNSPNFKMFNITDTISNFDHQLIISNELIRLNNWVKLFSAVNNKLPKIRKSLFDMSEVEKLEFLKTSRLENVEEVVQQYIGKSQVEITNRKHDVIEDTHRQRSIRIVLQKNPNVIKLCLFVIVVRLLLPGGLSLLNYILMNIVLNNLDAIIFIFIFVFLCIFLVVK